jgi:hypothetical protein
VLVASVPLPGWLPFRTSNDKHNAEWVREGVRLDSRWTSLFRTDVIGTPEGNAGRGGYRFIGVNPGYQGPSPPSSWSSTMPPPAR